jgi:hypothetical protein
MFAGIMSAKKILRLAPLILFPFLVGMVRRKKGKSLRLLFDILINSLLLISSLVSAFHLFCGLNFR